MSVSLATPGFPLAPATHNRTHRPLALFDIPLALSQEAFPLLAPPAQPFVARDAAGCSVGALAFDSFTEETERHGWPSVRRLAPARRC